MEAFAEVLLDIFLRDGGDFTQDGSAGDETEILQTGIRLLQ
jgi:hypothetical protein